MNPRESQLKSEIVKKCVFFYDPIGSLAIEYLSNLTRLSAIGTAYLQREYIDTHKLSIKLGCLFTSSTETKCFTITYS